MGKEGYEDHYLLAACVSKPMMYENDDEMSSEKARAEVKNTSIFVPPFLDQMSLLLRAKLEDDSAVLSHTSVCLLLVSGACFDQWLVFFAFCL